MVDDQGNYFKAAPGKGKQNGPLWKCSESFAKYMSNLAANKVVRGGYGKGLTPGAVSFASSNPSLVETTTSSTAMSSPTTALTTLVRVTPPRPLMQP